MHVGFVVIDVEVPRVPRLVVDLGDRGDRDRLGPLRAECYGKEEDDQHYLH